MKRNFCKTRWAWLGLWFLPLFPASAAVIFFDGFEGGLSPAWQVGDANPAGPPAHWAVVAADFGGGGTPGGTNKIYCAGVGYAGTSANPRYTNSMTAYLQRSVDLTSGTNATLSFWFKVPGIESDFDSAKIYLDGTPVWSCREAIPTWTQAVLNLDALAGEERILRFEFTSDTSANYEGWYLDDILVTDVYTPPPPPENDHFVSAPLLPNAVGSVVGNNTNATAEAGEPAPGNSVWYRWIAPTNGTVTFHTTHSGFDTVLCVYTGNSVTNLTLVACNDNGDTNGASVVSFPANMGTEYPISVRGAGGASGPLVLNWEQPNGAGAELLPDLFVWADESQDFLYGWFLDQEEMPGRTLLRLSTATPNRGEGALELQGSPTNAGVFQRVFLSGGGFYDRYAGAFAFHESHQHLHFDNWLNFHLRTVLPDNSAGDMVVSGDKTSFAIIDLQEYDLNLPGAATNAYYSGGWSQGLSAGWADVYSADLPDQWIDVTDVPSGRYWLEVIVDPENNIKESDESNNTTRILIDFVAPPPAPTNAPSNDHFTNAVAMSLPGQAVLTAGLFGHNFRAGKEGGEPLHFASTGGASVWYRWTAPANLPVTITTEGSDFDTILAVYTGSTLHALTLVGNNDDIGDGNFSAVTFTATAGMTYHIAVDGFGAAHGNIQLNFNPAWNDHLTDSVILSGNAGHVSGSNRGATRQLGEPLHAGVGGSNSLWFRWTPAQSGPAVFDTEGSNFDTLLGIYTGTSVTGLTPVASNDNDGLLETSRISFPVMAGATYQIVVDGGSGTKGIVKLNWLGPTPPTITQPPLSTNAPAGATVRFTITATGSAPMSYRWLFQGNEIADSEFISGTTSPTLTLEKIRATNQGSYRVVISNAFGMVTSSPPASLIVLNNYRTVFMEEINGDIGGVVSVPLYLQATGDEHALNFSLLYDPAILSNPRIFHSATGVVAVVNTNQTLQGKLGISLTLPLNQAILPGVSEWAWLLFDAAPELTAPTMTSIGFVNEPVAKLVTTTNGTALPTLFAAGHVWLRSVDAVEIGQILPDGRYQISLTGIAGRHYLIQVSDDLVSWTDFRTNTVNLDGTLQLIDNQSTNLVRRFYRAQLLP